MAWLMRTASFILVLIPGLLGCSAATTQPAPQTPDHAALLQEPAQARVIAHARAQTCRASQTGNPELAAQSQALLDAYVDLHEEHGVEPSRQLRKDIRRAHRDAAATRQGVATPYHLGCDPFSVPDRRALARGRQRRLVRQSIRRGQHEGSGGVIRDPRPGER